MRVNADGEWVETFHMAAHLYVETRVGVAVDQDVNDLVVCNGKVTYWLWERGDKGNQDVHEVSIGRDGVRLEMTPCRDRLKQREVLV